MKKVIESASTSTSTDTVSPAPKAWKYFVELQECQHSDVPWNDQP
jgi:hypothetical protein